MPFMRYIGPWLVEYFIYVSTFIYVNIASDIGHACESASSPRR